MITDDSREQTPKPLGRDYLPEVELRRDISSISLPVSLEPPEELVSQIPEPGDFSKAVVNEKPTVSPSPVYSKEVTIASTAVRRSTRVSKPPSRFDLSFFNSNCTTVG